MSVIIAAALGAFTALSAPPAVAADCNENGVPDARDLVARFGLQGGGGRIFPAGNSPFSTCMGDFDKDGDTDMAVTNRYPDTVSVLLNRGDGTFAARVVYGAGDAPNSVTAGDLDNDGDLDLAVANADDSSVSVLLNHRDGTFDAPVSFGAGDTPSSVAAGDMDGDGDLDLAVADSASNTIVVLLNVPLPPVSADCHGNGVPDECDIASGTDQDCNSNGVPDSCDIAAATSNDVDGNRSPDECDPDCNSNGLPDAYDIAQGTSADADSNGVPDECGGLQRPGDTNQDGALDLSDAVWLLGHLFLGAPGQETLPCESGTASSPGAGDLALCDVNGDERIDLSDPVSILGFLFLGTRPPALGTGCVRIVGCAETCP